MSGERVSHPAISQLHTVTIGTSDLNRVRTFYESTLGYEVSFERTLAGPTVEDFWGLPEGGTAHVVQLRKHVDVGQVRLMSFDPPATDSFQDPTRPYRIPGLANINLYVLDMDAAVAQLTGEGWTFLSEPHSFEFTDEITPREAIFFGPDGVMVNLVEPLGATRSQLGEVAEFPGRYSEVVTSAQATRDLEADLRFYGDVWGWDPYLSIEMTDERLNELEGLPPATLLRVVFFKHPESLRGKIALGAPQNLEWSDLPRVPLRPHGLGLLAISFRVDDLDAWADHLRTHGREFVMFEEGEASPHVIVDGSFAQTRAILTRAPNSTLIELFGA